jgi:hypothetical protein
MLRDRSIADLPLISSVANRDEEQDWFLSNTDIYHSVGKFNCPRSPAGLFFRAWRRDSAYRSLRVFGGIIQGGDLN